MPSSTTNANHPLLALYVLLISAIPNFVLPAEADPPILNNGYDCSSIKYANATAFNENLNTVFSQLAKNISSSGFATASSGKGIDAIYGLAQCRNDLSEEDCITCYTVARERIALPCPEDTGARTISDGCFLRYENSTFFDQAVDGGYSNVCISDASSNPKIFNQTVLNLLAEIKSKALENEGFATGEIRAKGLPTAIYGLAMCRRTLNTSGCDLCLETAIQIIQYCFSLQDGRGLEAGCYLRYSTVAFYSTRSSSSSRLKIVFILVGTLGGAALVVVLWHSSRKLHTKLSGPSQYEDAVERLLFSHKLKKLRKLYKIHFIAEEDPMWHILFTYDSLRSATKQFDPSMKIGEGGFGQVYKGIFNDGREVAVKKLFVQQSTRALHEYLTELKLVSTVRHRNLVRLLGGCTRGIEKLLVYEFMANTSLDKHLSANTEKPLRWKTRFGIILGTTRGLAYLNEECPLRILHRDIKAANILLDNDFQAKIADFGLARLFPEDKTHLTTRVGGTIGYVAPEYAVHGHLTDKADVYSYGILVLKIVSGRKYIDHKLPAHMQLLLEWAWSLYEENQAFHMADPRLFEEEPAVNKEEILKVIQIALLCTQGAPHTRPLMSKVVSVLTSNTEILAQPTQPAFIQNSCRANGLTSGNIEEAAAPLVASSQAPVSVSLEPR